MTTCETRKLTLAQTIARYYQQGKNPIEYKSTNSTEVMMMLYLTNKHNIIDPFQDDIRQKYRDYGRMTDRLKDLRKPPDFYDWALSLHFDKKNKLIYENSEDYFCCFYWKLMDIIEKNPGKKVACLFSITFRIHDGTSEGHSEVVLYDPALNILEHTDSNNIPKQCFRKDHTYFILCEMVQSILGRVAKALPSEPVFINNKNIYTDYEWGIQSMEAASDLHIGGEKEGYCLMWAVLFGDLALSFPEYSIREIVSVIKEKAKSKKVKINFVNDYMLTLIRGYAVHISREVDVSFLDESSKHNACIKLAK